MANRMTISRGFPRMVFKYCYVIVFVPKFDWFPRFPLDCEANRQKKTRFSHLLLKEQLSSSGYLTVWQTLMFLIQTPDNKVET